MEIPEAAVLAVGEEYAGGFAAMEDEYMAGRADDVCDVASQIAAEVTGRVAEGSRRWRRRRPSGLQPGPGTLAAFGSRAEEMAAERAALDEYRHVEVRTRDGRRMEVAANMSAPCISRAKKLL